jgi:hypothetical protein
MSPSKEFYFGDSGKEIRIPSEAWKAAILESKRGFNEYGCRVEAEGKHLIGIVTVYRKNWLGMGELKIPIESDRYQAISQINLSQLETKFMGWRMMKELGIDRKDYPGGLRPDFGGAADDWHLKFSRLLPGNAQPWRAAYKTGGISFDDSVSAGGLATVVENEFKWKIEPMNRDEFELINGLRK